MSSSELYASFEKQSEEILELRLEVKELKEKIENLLKFQENNSSKTLSEDNKLSIIFKKYKKSILVKNMYSHKNTTSKCKDVFKNLEAKWLYKEMGWLFVGKFNEEKSLEDNCNYIEEKLKEEGYEIEKNYERE